MKRLSKNTKLHFVLILYLRNKKKIFLLYLYFVFCMVVHFIVRLGIYVAPSPGTLLLWWNVDLDGNNSPVREAAKK